MRLSRMIAIAGLVGCVPPTASSVELPPNLRCADLIAVATSGERFDACSIGGPDWRTAGVTDDDSVRKAVVASAAHDIPCDATRVTIKLLPRRRDSVDAHDRPVRTYFNGSRDILVDGCGQRITYVESCNEDRAPDELGFAHFQCEYVISARLSLGT